MVRATSDLGLILVNHTVILTADCLLTSSSAQGSCSQVSVCRANSAQSSVVRAWSLGSGTDGEERDLGRTKVCYCWIQGWKENGISLCVLAAIIESHMQIKLWSIS